MLSAAHSGPGGRPGRGPRCHQLPPALGSGTGSGAAVRGESQGGCLWGWGGAGDLMPVQGLVPVPLPLPCRRRRVAKLRSEPAWAAACGAKTGVSSIVAGGEGIPGGNDTPGRPVGSLRCAGLLATGATPGVTEPRGRRPGGATRQGPGVPEAPRAAVAARVRAGAWLRRGAGERVAAGTPLAGTPRCPGAMLGGAERGAGQLRICERTKLLLVEIDTVACCSAGTGMAAGCWPEPPWTYRRIAGEYA